MSPAKIYGSTIKQALSLHGQGREPAEIAHLLGLKRMQVCALLAYEQVTGKKSITETTPFDEAELRGQEVEEVQEEPREKEGEVEGEAKAGADEDTGIYVGDDREYGDPIYWVPSDPRLVYNPHLMIMGESGSGKTYAAQCLVAELSHRGIPSVIFDYGQSFELENLEKTFQKYSHPVEHQLGEKGLSLNPLQIFPNDIHGPKQVATRLSDVFDAVYHLGDIQKKVLIDAVLGAFDKAGITASDQAGWQKSPPALSVLQEVLEKLAGDKNYPSYRNAATVAARLMTFFMLNSLHTEGPPWSWDSFVIDPKQKVNILQFRGLEGKTQRVVVEILLWHLFFYLKSRGQSDLKLYCVLDEAHHLSFRDGGPLDALLREGRKFGLGLIFASQQPEDFSPAAFSNSASKLVFQTADPTLRVSKFLASKCVNYDGPDEIHNAISTLSQGQALFITKNKGHIVSVANLKLRGALWSER